MRPRRRPPPEEREQHVIAGKRNPQKPPGRLVAADQADAVLQLVHDVLRVAEFVDRSGTVVRARPPFPFDARVIGGQACIPQHSEHDRQEAKQQNLARGTVLGAEPQQRRQRNAEIERDPLLEAERARQDQQHILEEVDRGDTERADRRRWPRLRSAAGLCEQERGSRSLCVPDAANSVVQLRLQAKHYAALLRMPCSNWHPAAAEFRDQQFRMRCEYDDGGAVE